MTVTNDGFYAGKQFPLALDKIQYPSFVQRCKIVLHKTSPVFLGRPFREIPMFALNVVLRLGERRYELSVLELRAATAMVKMQMGENHIGDVGGRDAILSQRFFQVVVRVIETVNIFQLIRPFRAIAIVDENDLIIPDNKETSGRESDAVAGIGRIGLRPKNPRHYSEHCTAVEGKAPGLDRMDSVVTDLHDNSQERNETKKVGHPEG